MTVVDVGVEPTGIDRVPVGSDATPAAGPGERLQIPDSAATPND